MTNLIFDSFHVFFIESHKLTSITSNSHPNQHPSSASSSFPFPLPPLSTTFSSTSTTLSFLHQHPSLLSLSTTLSYHSIITIPYCPTITSYVSTTALPTSTYNTFSINTSFFNTSLHSLQTQMPPPYPLSTIITLTLNNDLSSSSSSLISPFPPSYVICAIPTTT